MIDVLIIGAGFAGASTAFHLSRNSDLSVIIVEKEELPGYHASGRNASLVLQSVAEPEVRRLLTNSRRQYARLAQEIGFRPCGSLLLGTAQELEQMRDDEVESSILTQQEVIDRVPILDGHSFSSALWTPSDGIMDIARLLNYYLQEARNRGTQIQCNCGVTGIEGKGPFRVHTTTGTIEAAVVVNAAGAWARSVARMAGASSPTLNAYKRHLFVLDRVDSIDHDWPFVWSLDRNFYFRPESGGLLFSICDEELETENFEESISDGISERLAELILSELPLLHNTVQRQVWSCFRTKTADGLFQIGPDPLLESFYWVAGLGGHGMGSSWEVGRKAAEAILARTPAN
ncbi:MAG TPA: FAD-dependent oxidoreductase [Acidobacteriota bacterium]|nr:FAD-dependent oxidoreductase [Acidobacteriota bacterium]